MPGHVGRKEAEKDATYLISIAEARFKRAEA